MILTLSTPAACLPGCGVAGFGVSCAAIEAFCRHLAGELGPLGVRVVCLRPDAIPEAARNGSHSREVFRLHAERVGMTSEEFWGELKGGTLLCRLPTLAEVANVAAFMGSDQVRAVTATVANMTCGSIVD
ncbi:MAG: SDR family oxidoreductase [Acidimicrobiales bacterium]